MNDRHPPEDPYPAAPASAADHASYASYDQQGAPYGSGSYPGYDGYDAYGTGSVATSTVTSTAHFPTDGGYATDSFTPGAFAGAGSYDSDPLFGDFPGGAPGSDGFGTGGAYGTGQWADGGAYGAGAHDPLSYDPYGAQQQAHQHTDYGAVGYDSSYGAAGYAGHGSYETGGQWDATAWAEADGQTPWATDPYATGTTQAPQPAQAPDTQGFAPGQDTFAAQQFAESGYETQSHEAQIFDPQHPTAHGYAVADGHPTHGYAPDNDYAAQGFDGTQGFEAAQGFDGTQSFDTAQGYDTGQGFAPHGAPTTFEPTTTFETQAFETSHFENGAFEPDQAFGNQAYETQAFTHSPFENQAQTPQAQAPQAQVFETQVFETQAFSSGETQSFPSGPPAPAGPLEPELVDYERELADIDPHSGFDDAPSGTTAFGDSERSRTEYAAHPDYPDAKDPVHSSPEDAYGDADTYRDNGAHTSQDEDGNGYEDDGDGDGHDPAPSSPGRPASVRASSRSSESRSRRRAPAKRSALLTVAVPSVCVIGVAGVAAASVGGFGGDDKQTTASADAHALQPSEANNKLDTQLNNLSADTRDFADRASRTQERIDLEAKQEAKRKKAAEEAARKERLRPKFVLPVTRHGLSAYFGQAGVNWMSVHTGIDFPVAYGTQVMAATDGTVRMQYNSSYGNMAIVTAKDGTETWYCHLSSYRVSSGTTVKAGDVIAFSGNTGNTTGPHLHFEVRPNGGAAIDPLPWLRSHGLDPT